MSIAELFKRTSNLMTENSTTLLTAVGVTGTVTTAVLTGRASFKAARMIDEKWEKDEDLSGLPGKVVFRENLALVWPQFIPPIGVGALTIAAIITANRLSAKEAAALATAYGVSERAFQEYREKVVERLGENKETSIRDEIAQDRVSKTAGNQPIIVASGKVLCMEMFTGRYFESTMEDIKKAVNDTNFEIVNHMYASLSSFYDRIGLPATEMSDVIGWNSLDPLEVSYTSAMAPNDRPCIAISFDNNPIANYDRIY